MRSPKIIALVKAIALAHGIKVDKLHVGFRAAMVLHGIIAESEYIELFVDVDTWSELAKWHKPMFDSLGGRLLLPNGVTVSCLSSLKVEHTWESRSEIRMASPESLEAAYQHYVENKYDYRKGLLKQDTEYCSLVTQHIVRHRRIRYDEKCIELKGFAPLIVNIPELMKLLEMSKNLESGGYLVTEFKDVDQHRRWEIKLTETTLSLKELVPTGSTRLHEHHIYKLDNIHRLVQE